MNPPWPLRPRLNARSLPLVRPFLEAVAEGPLLFDGAMGSLLYERGIFHNRNYDELNLSRPELIRSIHTEYVNAGASVIETNTFSANRLALARHGHAEKAEEINMAGAALAREVANDRVYVAGAVGPSGVDFKVASAADRELAEQALRDQLTWLVKGGVDLLVVETFTSIVELEAAIAIARDSAPGLPLVAQLVFSAEGVAEGGLTPPEVGERLIAAGADVIGANCGAGPPELFEVGKRMVGLGAPVVLQPNAGLPSVIEQRTIYVANPEHFGVFARRMLKSGVQLIGGCCGTTPAHTRAMLGAVRMMGAPTSDPAPSNDCALTPALTTARFQIRVSPWRSAADWAPEWHVASSRFRWKSRPQAVWIRGQPSTRSINCSPGVSTSSTSQTVRARRCAWRTWLCARLPTPRPASNRYCTSAAATETTWG